MRRHLLIRQLVSEKNEMNDLDASQIGEYGFEALSEKESQWSISGIMGDAVAWRRSRRWKQRIKIIL